MTRKHAEQQAAEHAAARDGQAAHRGPQPARAGPGIGGASEISDRVNDDMTAPPIPWIIRKPISIVPGTDRAQSAEASVKRVTPLTKMRLRPK
jgi:hypothetical protein